MNILWTLVRFLKKPSVLISIVCAAVLLFGYVYVDGLRDDRNEALNKLSVVETQRDNYQDRIKTLEHQKEVYVESLKNYSEDLQESKTRNMKLSNELEHAGERDDQLQACLNYNLDSAILDSLSE